MSVLSDIFGGLSNIATNAMNLNYQKNLQQELFNRDDTAIRRRMADYESAGINPLLALGNSGAGNTSTGGISMQAFQPSLDPMERKGKKIENEILGEKKKQEELITEGLKKDNVFKDLNYLFHFNQNEKLAKELKALDSAQIYPFSTGGRIYADITQLGDSEKMKEVYSLLGSMLGFKGLKLPDINLGGINLPEFKFPENFKLPDFNFGGFNFNLPEFKNPFNNSGFQEFKQNLVNLMGESFKRFEYDSKEGWQIAKELNKEFKNKFRITYDNMAGKFTVQDLNKPEQKGIKGGPVLTLDELFEYLYNN